MISQFFLAFIKYLYKDFEQSVLSVIVFLTNDCHFIVYELEDLISVEI